MFWKDQKINNMTYALLTMEVRFVLISVLAIVVCIGGYKFEENNDKQK